MNAKKITRHALSALFLSAAALGARADVLVVDSANGPGTDFTLIQAAVSAAVDGDTILVRPGGGYVEQVAIVNKSVSLIADGDVFLTAFSVFTFGFSPTISILSLDPGREVVVRGFSLTSGPAVADSQGTVWFEDISVSGIAQCYDGGVAGARIENSTGVTFNRCTLVGQNGNSIDASAYAPAPGLNAIDSTVSLYDCIVRGGWARSLSTYYPHIDGGIGLRNKNSTVSIFGCEIEGGEGGGGPSPICENEPGFGGPGVKFIAGGSPVIRSAASTSVGGVTNLDALCSGMVGWEGPAIEGTGTIVPLAGFARHLQAASPVRGGETLTFEVEGVEGEIPALLVSDTHTPIFLAPYNGILLPQLPPTDIYVLDALPPSGQSTLDFAVPNIAGIAESLEYYVQAIFLDPNPTIWIGAGTAVTLLEATF